MTDPAAARLRDAHFLAHDADPDRALSSDAVGRSSRLTGGGGWVGCGGLRRRSSCWSCWSPASTTNGALRTEITTALRTHASPRHVPDEVIAVPAVPHTRTGKKPEVPVKRVLQGAPPGVRHRPRGRRPLHADLARGLPGDAHTLQGDTQEPGRHAGRGRPLTRGAYASRSGLGTGR